MQQQKMVTGGLKLFLDTLSSCTAFDCRILAGNGGKLRCSQAELTPTIKAAVDMFSSISCRYPEIEGGILEDFPSHPVTEPFGFTKALGALSRNNVENTERALKGSEGRGDRSMLCFARPICLYSDEWSDDGASTHDVCVHFGLKPPPFDPCTDATARHPAHLELPSF